MKNKLRLILFPDCDRSCEGCCNKDWDLEALDVCTDFSGYDEVLVTGGEPLLKPGLTAFVIGRIRGENPKARVIVYTARSHPKFELLDIVAMADGITLTLHEQSDVPRFDKFQKFYKQFNFEKSMRLNVFSNVDISGVDTEGWVVSDNMEWEKDCPLPDNEVFMRYWK